MRDMVIDFASFQKCYRVSPTYFCRRASNDPTDPGAIDCYMSVDLALIHCLISDPADIAIFEETMKPACFEADDVEDAQVLCVVKLASTP